MLFSLLSLEREHACVYSICLCILMCSKCFHCMQTLCLYMKSSTNTHKNNMIWFLKYFFCVVYLLADGYSFSRHSIYHLINDASRKFDEQQEQQNCYCKNVLIDRTSVANAWNKSDARKRAKRMRVWTKK